MAPSRGLPRSLHVSLNNHKGPVNVARYAKGSAKYILTGGQDRSIRLWNAAHGSEIKVFTAHGYEVLSISVWVRRTSYMIYHILTFPDPMTTPSSHRQGAIALFSCGMLRLVLLLVVLQVIWVKFMLSSSMRMRVWLPVVRAPST
jgi:WD40 repeat protein